MNAFLCRLLYAVAFLSLAAADSIVSFNTTERYAATTRFARPPVPVPATKLVSSHSHLISRQPYHRRRKGPKERIRFVRCPLERRQDGVLWWNGHPRKPGSHRSALNDGAEVWFDSTFNHVPDGRSAPTHPTVAPLPTNQPTQSLTGRRDDGKEEEENDPLPPQQRVASLPAAPLLNASSCTATTAPAPSPPAPSTPRRRTSPSPLQSPPLPSLHTPR